MVKKNSGLKINSIFLCVENKHNPILNPQKKSFNKQNHENKNNKANPIGTKKLQPWIGGWS